MVLRDNDLFTKILVRFKNFPIKLLPKILPKKLLKELLNKINFNKNDKMIICGDVIDKGNNSIKLLKYIRKQSNMFFIIGNHEYEFLKYYNRLMLEVEDGFDYNKLLTKINDYFPLHHHNYIEDVY